MDERVDHQGNALEAMEQFLEEFKKVKDGDGFMAAVWIIRENRLQLTCCTTSNFPLESRPIAEKHLREVNLEEARLAMTPPPALPVASGFPPAMPPERILPTDSFMLDRSELLSPQSEDSLPPDIDILDAEPYDDKLIDGDGEES